MTEKSFFGDCCLDSTGTLYAPAGDIQLTNLLRALLTALIEAGPTTVSTDELLNTAWGVGRGTPQNLANAIHKLRQTLKSSKSVEILSVYGRGYRLKVNPSLPSAHESEAFAKSLCREAEHRLQYRSGAALNAANLLYERALSISPSHSPAAIGYARTHFQLLADGFVKPSTGWSRVLHAVCDTQKFKPLCAEVIAFQGLGECAFHWDFETAESTLSNALQLAPNSAVVNWLAGRAFLFRGLHRRAIEYFRTSLQINPVDASTRGQLAYALSAIGDIDAANRELDYQLLLDPANPVLKTYAIYLEAAYGDPAKACKLVQEKLEYQPTSASTKAIEAFALARAGNTSAAVTTLRFITNTYSVPPEGNALSCLAWVALGDHEAALRALQAAAKARDFPLGMMLHDPNISPLHGTLAFASLYDSVFSGAHAINTLNHERSSETAA